MAPRVPLGFNFRDESRRVFKPKSQLFRNIEDALDNYVRSSTAVNLRTLTEQLGAWKLSKRQGMNWVSSRRPQVERLSDWLIEESRGLLFPLSRDWWEDNTSNINCYAYAMKCMIPAGRGNNSHPGLYAGTPAARPATQGVTFANGVVADAAHQGREVVVLRRGGAPLPVPVGLPGDKYLVAMVATSMGYHFMRRRESTGLWTHKNGAWNPVETYFYDLDLQQPVPITNEVVGKMLTRPQIMGCSMAFDSYLSVPKRGIQVQG